MIQKCQFWQALCYFVWIKLKIVTLKHKIPIGSQQITLRNLCVYNIAQNSIPLQCFQQIVAAGFHYKMHISYLWFYLSINNINLTIKSV